MGKLIAFWSPWHGQAKTTASMVAVALALNNISGDRVVMFHTQSGMANLEGMLEHTAGREKRMENYEKVGFEHLLRISEKENITSNEVIQSALPTVMRELFYIPGMVAKRDGLFANRNLQEDLYTIATSNIPQAFDWSFVDLASGNNLLSMKIMDVADMVVVMLSQNIATWDRFFEEFEALSEKENVFFVLGGHKTDSAYGIKEFRRYRHIDKNKCGVVPDCVGYMDAISEGRVCNFFLMNEDAKMDDENALFIGESKSVAMRVKNYFEEKRKSRGV